MRLFPLLTLLTALWLPGGAMADEPLTVIRQTVEGVIQVLESRQDGTRLAPADRQAIHDIIDNRFDFYEMSKRSMGRIWKKIDKEQRRQFVPVFQELLERNYGNRLAGFSGQTVVYGKVTQDEKRAKVDTEIDNDGISIPVRYSLYNNGSAWLVYDIRIEGVSLVATFRSDFKTIFKKSGFDGLLAQLGKKVDSLKRKDSSS
ncbi:MAG: ABC transporter substrate-binding protein [Mariprofundaceae bacterium]